MRLAMANRARCLKVPSGEEVRRQDFEDIGDAEHAGRYTQSSISSVGHPRCLIFSQSFRRRRDAKPQVIPMLIDVKNMEDVVGKLIDDGL